ncbi:hypothetical protein [Serratia sp. 14-2641]|uniref:hypothetical protein n=1 Tax=Serratia sp. 14-2641 TaxID=1841657 RepID=UPI00080FCE85|nr:hypothetical protein [Serratia sp. 14-2641]OCJ29063.1 hypothetical protein A6U95_28195 [Serratia sp. 14-2641]
MGQDLTPEQARFAVLLTDYPQISGYWDFATRRCDENALRSALAFMSRGERQVALFFLSLWTGNDEGFDLLEAARVVDSQHRQLVIHWLRDPFWP